MLSSETSRDCLAFSISKTSEISRRSVITNRNHKSVFGLTASQAAIRSLALTLSAISLSFNGNSTSTSKFIISDSTSTRAKSARERRSPRKKFPLAQLSILSNTPGNSLAFSSFAFLFPSSSPPKWVFPEHPNKICLVQLTCVPRKKCNIALLMVSRIQKDFTYPGS